MPQEPPPDIVLLGAEWQPRAMIRAQLIEAGFDVVATNTWPMMRRQLRPGSKPRLAIVDLKGLSNPQDVLNDLRVLMNPKRVLSRPIAIKDVVDAAADAIRSGHSPSASPSP